jgi:hypothetical protein
MLNELQPQQQPKPPFNDVRQSASYFFGLSQIVSRPLEAWLRRPGTWGARYVNYQWVLGWLFIPLFWAFFCSGQSPKGLFWFMGLTACMLALHRVRGWHLRRLGYRPHSRYVGQSWLSLFFSELNAKGNWEPTVAICAGAALLWVDIPLGVYLIVAGNALFFATGWQRAADAAKLRQLRDARLEQQWFMEQMQQDE